MTDFDPTGHGGICAVGRQLTGGPALDLFLTGGAAGLWRSWYAPTGWLTNRAGALILRPVDVGTRPALPPSARCYILGK